MCFRKKLFYSSKFFGTPSRGKWFRFLWLFFALTCKSFLLTSCQAKPQIEEQFSLKDLTPPQVISILPVNGTTEVTDKPTIVIVFNEPMDAATLNSSTVTVKTGNGTPGVGSYEYDATNYALTIKIVQNLYLNTQYTITVTDNVKDKAGNAIAPVTSIFSTDVCPKARKRKPAFNDEIYALAKVGCTIFVGGKFTSVGEASAYGVAIDPITADMAASFTYEDINGAVHVVVPDGQGGFYLGGEFTRVGNYTRNRLAHIAASGEVLPWNPGANGTVLAIALSGNTIYVGGEFTTIGGNPRNRLAAIGTDGTLLPWNPDANDKVRALAVSNSDVYVGGDFTNIGGNTRNHLAAIGTDGTLLPWNPNANYDVYALAVSGSTIYAGGDFTSIGCSSDCSITPVQTRNRLAAIGTDGSLLNWNPNANSTVRALAISGSTVYAGGLFTTIGASTRYYLAAIDTNGTLLNWDPSLAIGTSAIYALAVSGTTVYVGGRFVSIGGNPRNHLAAISITDGPTGCLNNYSSSCLLSWNPKVSGVDPVEVYAVASSGSLVYAGGNFLTLGGLPRNRLAALATDGSLLSFNPNVGGTGSLTVMVLRAFGNKLYVGGSFDSVGGNTRNNLAALNIEPNCLQNYSASCLLPWNPNANGVIYAMAISGSTVYVGGSFSNVGGQGRNAIAALDASSGSAILTWNPNANGTVYTLAVNSSNIYAGGLFSHIGGQSRTYLAAIDLTTGSATSWNPNPYGEVHTIAVSGSTLYVGGQFTSIGGNPRNRLAAFGNDGTLLPWDPNVGNNTVFDLALGPHLFAVGSFTSVGGQIRNRLAAIDMANGALTPWDPGADSHIRTVIYSNSTLYLGGAFTAVSGLPQYRLASINTDGSVNW